MTMTDIANDLLAQLAELDKETEEGVDDPIWLFERTSKLVTSACDWLKHFDKATTRIVELTPENCNHNRAVEPDTGECLDCGEILP